jgi:hypothetical protein
MPITPESVADHIAGILPDLNKGNFESVAADLQQYPIMEYWLKSLRLEMGSGLTIRKNLMQTTAGAARHTAPDATDRVDIPNLLSYITVPWRHVQTQWAYNYQADILMNSGDAQIVDLVKMRLHGAMIDLAKELESKAWALCASDNTVDPYGIPNWIVYTASAAPGSFAGGLASGWTNKAGLTDLTNFKNYCATYVTVSKTDLLPSMRQAHEQTWWISPVTTAQANTDQQRKLRYYTNSYVNRRLETMGEAQNENLGRDVAPYVAGGDPDVRRDDMIGGAALTFRRHPIMFVPLLNDSALFPTSIATNPIYQIDHSTFETYCLKGDYLRQTGPDRVPDQHNNHRVFSDTSYAHVCRNLRRQAVFSQ